MSGKGEVPLASNLGTLEYGSGLEQTFLLILKDIDVLFKNAQITCLSMIWLKVLTISCYC